jgi:hypothetical protein
MWKYSTSYGGTYIADAFLAGQGFYSYAGGQFRVPPDTAAYGCAIGGSGFFGTSVIGNFLNKWSHVAYSRSGTTLSVYVNGSFAASCTTTSSATVSNPVFKIGNYLGGRDLTGTADEVRLYNRPLSAAEIKELYLFGK